MRNFLLALAVLCVLVPSPARADDNTLDSSSRSPGYGRYEIVQGPLPSGGTWRVDRFCGEVAQLAPGRNGVLTWKLAAPNGQACILDRTHYQLVVSAAPSSASASAEAGTDASFPTVVLVNIDTGRSWQLQKLPNAPPGGPDTQWIFLGP